MKTDQFLKESRSFQETTKDNYGRHLSNIQEWLQSNSIKIEQLTCEKFLEYLETKPWGNSMKRGSLNVLKSYLHWANLESHELITTRKLIPKEKPTGLRFSLKEDVEKLQAACKRCQGAMRIRNMAIIAVLFDSWVRVSELIDVRQ